MMPSGLLSTTAASMHAGCGSGGSDPESAASDGVQRQVDAWSAEQARISGGQSDPPDEGEESEEGHAVVAGSQGGVVWGVQPDCTAEFGVHGLCPTSTPRDSVQMLPWCAACVDAADTTVIIEQGGAVLRATNLCAYPFFEVNGRWVKTDDATVFVDRRPPVYCAVTDAAGFFAADAGPTEVLLRPDTSEAVADSVYLFGSELPPAPYCAL